MGPDNWVQNNQLTLEIALRSAAEWLDGYNLVYGHGTANSLDEAAWLILEAMDLSPLEAPDYSRVLSKDEKLRAQEYLRKRATERMPAAYITGRTWFAGLEFKADERALVPRSPLAEPIMQGFSEYIDPTGVKRVLDLCTGGGCIAIACAYAFADAEVDGADISNDALSLATENIEKHGLQERVNLIESDVFSAIPENSQYDLIISNPPYVDAEDMAELADEFHQEPQLGLAAGHDGLDVVRQILAQAAGRLSPSGILVCEVGNSAVALESTYPGIPFQWLSFGHGGEGIFLLTKEELASLSDQA